MANLQAVLDEGAFSTLDESLKTFYTQNSENKSFYLNLPDTEAEKLAFGLSKRFNDKKTALDTLHKEHNELKSKLKPYEEFGKSADEIKAALEANRPEEVNKLLTEKDEKHRLAIESFESTIKSATEKAEKYQKQLLKTAVDTHIAKIRNQYDLNDVADYVLRDYYRAEETEDGSVAVRIYENGNPALVANQPKTDEQLLNGFRENKQFLSIFNAANGGGTGGTNRQNTTNSGAKTMKRSEYNSRQAADPQGIQKFFAEGGQVIDD